MTRRKIATQGNVRIGFESILTLFCVSTSADTKTTHCLASYCEPALSHQQCTNPPNSIELQLFLPRILKLITYMYNNILMNSSHSAWCSTAIPTFCLHTLPPCPAIYSVCQARSQGGSGGLNEPPQLGNCGPPDSCIVVLYTVATIVNDIHS